MTDNNQANTLHDMIRGVFSAFNKGIYFLLGAMYQIFFNVSSAQLFENETVKNFYARIQLIIGVFMIFKLAVTILQGIMDPDKFTNPKEGIGNVITRIVTALAMLTLLVPINIPNPTNSFEIYINNNGLLFGTLYSLQDRILTGNTLGRLILGTTDGQTTSEENGNDGLTETEKQTAKLQKSARIFSATILKGFLRINLLPEDVREDDDETKNKNRYCQDIDEDLLKTYTQLDVDTGSLLDLATVSCDLEGNFFQNLGNIVAKIPFISVATSFLGNTRYVFAFEGFPALVVGIIFLVILIGFTIDIAIRSIKLSILRLIAPIPIISYIDPKSSKDGAFASWVKALTSTYLDLFLRLAIVYFVIFLIQDMIVNGMIINNNTGMVGIISLIFIWIGLFFFARMAPKFIKDALGMKGNMGNVGLSGILGGGAMLLGGGGVKGAALGFMQGTEAEVQGYNQGKPQSLMNSWSQNRDFMAKLRTGDKDARGGILGSTMDRLNYQTRENNAEKLGYGKNNKAKADWNKKQLQILAGNAADEYEDAKMDLDNFLQTGDKSDPTYSSIVQQKTQAVREARMKKSSADIAFQKASGAADKIDKYRAQLGAAPRISDIPRETYRSEARVNDDKTTGYNMRDDGEFNPNRVDDFIIPGNEPFDPFKGSTHASGKGSSSDTTVDDSTFSGSHNGPMGPGGPGGGPGGHP